jgi:hypothetical protein
MVEGSSPFFLYGDPMLQGIAVSLTGTTSSERCQILLESSAEVSCDRTQFHEGGRRRVARRELVQLGWPHFWLLAGILAGMLALVVLVFFAYLLSV